MLAVDKPLYDYKGSICGIRIYKIGGQSVVVFIHPKLATGNSVTNQIENFIGQAADEFGLKHKALTVIDYHPGIVSSSGSKIFGTEISTVSFQHDKANNFHKPKWTKICIDDLATLTNTKIHDWQPYHE